jgi:hypothetical protein
MTPDPKHPPGPPMTLGNMRKSEFVNGWRGQGAILLLV